MASPPLRSRTLRGASSRLAKLLLLVLATLVGISGQVTTLVSGLDSPEGVAADAQGNVYIASQYGNAIEKWDAATGQLTTLVPGLFQPFGVAVDIAGNVYMTDTGNGAIKKWNVSNHQVTTLVSSGLSQPLGVAVDGQGNVYIADSVNNAVKKWSVSNQQVTTLVGTGLGEPFGVAVDAQGNVFIADTHAIKKWSVATQQVTTVISLGSDQPVGVAVDRQGNVYMATGIPGAVKEWNPSNQRIATLALCLSSCGGVAVDGQGNVYFSDPGNAVVNVVGTSAACTAPLLSTQPTSQTVASGQTVTLSVSASGSTPLTYQWYQGNSGVTANLVGTNSASFTTPALSSGASYWVRVSNGCGSVDSAAATISIGQIGSASGPVGWYAFDTQGNVGRDSIGGNDGAATGVTQGSGVKGLAASFQGGYILLPTTPTFNLRAGDFTLSVFVKGLSASANRSWFAKSIGGTHLYGLGGQDFATLGFDGGGGGSATSTTKVFDGNWHHVAGVKRGNVAEIWVDGKREATGTISGTNEGGQFAIGRLGQCCDSFTGQMDEAKVWNHALSSSEIASEAAGTGSTGGACTAPSLTTQPQSVTVSTGQSATLTAAASGSAPLAYQWYQGSTLDTSKPVGTNSSSFTTPALTASTSYWVQVTNACGAVNSATAQITLSPASALPFITSASVVNAASQQVGLVPGSLATIYGLNLTDNPGTTIAGGTPWPTQLAHTRVLIGGVAAPIQSVSQQGGYDQINIQVPWETAGGLGATVVIDNNGKIGGGVNVPVYGAQPALFGGTAYHADYHPVTSANPAGPGETLILYATGLGAVDHQPANGFPAPSAEPFSRTPSTFVSIGLPATVPFAGLAGGFIGLYQINVQVPLNAAAGTLSLAIRAASGISPAYSIPVALGSPAGFFSADTFTDPNDPLWMVADHDGPGNVTRSDNVIFPAKPAKAGACGAVLPVIYLTLLVPGTNCAAAYSNGGTGGQVQMFSPIHYGYYEAYMQTSLAAGTVNSMFMFSSQPVSSDGNEIDIEILSQENDISHHTGLVHFTVFLPQGRKVTATVPLPFAPWAGLHKYGFNWTPDGIVWYIDQQPASITTCATSVVTPSAETLVSNPSCFAGAQNVPQFPGLLIVNHWTNGQSWSGPAPSADAAMTVYNVVLSPLKR